MIPSSMPASTIEPYGTTQWSPANRLPTIRLGEVHVWRTPVVHRSGELESLEQLLDCEESMRARALAVPDARRRFVTAHATLRLIVGAAIGSDAVEVQFGRRCAICNSPSHGKPHLISGDDRPSSHDRIDFSISHSGDFVLVAVARAARVGVDVERIRSRTDILAIATHAFGRKTSQDIEGLPPDDQRRRFFRLWTLAEAYGKARGTGLAGVSLDRIEDGWWLKGLNIAPEYAAAVVADRVLKLRLWHHDWSLTRG
jgi:4'-phosphopantetheinyl transferase